jgi:hypothetical protein
MKRRRFLQGAGVILAGGTTAPGGDPRASAGKSTESRGSAAGLRVLITSAEYRLAQTLADALSREHRVRLTGQTEVQTAHPFVRCDLGHDPATDDLVRGMDAIVHVAECPLGASDAARIDLLTYGTYNLLTAASELKVPRLILLSTLSMMTSYDENLQVTETWRPRPGCDTGVLSKYLGEFTCREFAREGKIAVVILRLGKVVRAEEVRGKLFDPMWVEERDVVQAVSKALQSELRDHHARYHGWWIYNIQSESPRSRFPVGTAKYSLHYEPQFSFENPPNPKAQ